MTVRENITPTFFTHPFPTLVPKNSTNTSWDIVVPMLQLDDYMFHIEHWDVFVVTFSYIVVIENPENS